MSGPYDLQRFIRAQDGAYKSALAELRAGSKQSHWMWFIFPQLRGLGRSPTAEYFGISSINEARAYLENDVLGSRLRQCTEAMLPWSGRRTAAEILGGIDAMKLRSSLTLFDAVEPHGLFDRSLLNFFSGERDERTLALLDHPQ